MNPDSQLPDESRPVRKRWRRGCALVCAAILLGLALNSFSSLARWADLRRDLYFAYSILVHEIHPHQDGSTPKLVIADDACLREAFPFTAALCWPVRRDAGHFAPTHELTVHDSDGTRLATVLLAFPEEQMKVNDGPVVQIPATWLARLKACLASAQ